MGEPAPIRYRFTAKDRAEEQNIDHLVYPRFTRTVKTCHLSKTPYGNDAFELIRNNDVRDEQIVKDVAAVVRAGRTPVVLTKYVDHAENVWNLWKNCGKPDLKSGWWKRAVNILR